MKQLKLGIIGLGYVGLPLALAFARKFRGTVGFDIDAEKVAQIKAGRDPTREGYEQEIRDSSLQVGSTADVLAGCNFFIVGVPTPVDVNHNPDLGPLLSACESVGRTLSRGSIVVFESTVYPGVTEDICGPRLAKISGLRQGVDFKLAYSPERMNPGDREHSLARVVKVVSGEDVETLDVVAEVYGAVVEAGVHRASSIKVAEAAKVIENTQRDLNIALMNELAIIFDRIGIATRDVLAAAATKWNFVRFSPGLVGGHCIGVDPYYLTTKAEQLHYHPQVILSGRRINDGMGIFLAQRMVKEMVNAGIQPKGARVGVLGLTFKENVSDIRNSRVPDIIRELAEFGVDVQVHDPLADNAETQEEYGLRLCALSELKNLDGLVLAVAHTHYRQLSLSEITSRLKIGGVLVDVKSVLDRSKLPQTVNYWSL